MEETAEEFQRRVESIRRAMAEAWAAGYAQGREDMLDDPLAPVTPNPFAKENS